MAERKRRVFVSYAHEDRKWVDELETFLTPWIRKGRLELFEDRRIEAGAHWKVEIDAALDDATVAVLLVTPAFLASAFIAEHELPRILERARRNEMRVRWVAVGHAPYEATPLHNIQAVNDPTRPLATLPRPKRDAVLSDIARQVTDSVTLGTFAEGLRVIDQTTEPLRAAVEGRAEEPDPTFGVQAEYAPQRDEIVFHGASTTITVGDIGRLPPKDREYIADLEDTMDENYKRWRVVKKRLGAAGGTLDAEVKRELKRIARLMCEDLNAILDFLRKMHKGELEDHYGRYRDICDRYGSR